MNNKPSVRISSVDDTDANNETDDNTDMFSIQFPLCTNYKHSARNTGDEDNVKSSDEDEDEEEEEEVMADQDNEDEGSWGSCAMNLSYSSIFSICSQDRLEINERRQQNRQRSHTGLVTKPTGLAYLASKKRTSINSSSKCINNSNNNSGRTNNTTTDRRQSCTSKNSLSSNFLQLPVDEFVRPRIRSMPESRFESRFSDDFYRLRTFSISKSGSVVNCGDSLISRSSKSNTSLNSSNSTIVQFNDPLMLDEDSRSCCLPLDYETRKQEFREMPEVSRSYRVLMLGDSGVGKSSLVQQFMTSDFINTYDTSLDDEFAEKTISLLVDNVQSELKFYDHVAGEISVENSMATYDPDACVIVYAVNSKKSFKLATEMINYLFEQNFCMYKSCILVGNKCDLARSRLIDRKTGCRLAIEHNAKFIETSSGLQFNVDELLVGICRQIELKATLAGGGGCAGGRGRSGRHRSISSSIVSSGSQSFNWRSLGERFLRTKSKSCQNLFVL